jgi:cytosine deaminase
MELTLRNVRIAGAGAETVDIGVQGGHIVQITPGLQPAADDHDCGGRLALPGFVETHIHLDKSCILDRCSPNGGDLGKAIGEVARLKADFVEEDVCARASRTLHKCIVNGTTQMRTHVEVDPVVGLRGYHGTKQAIARHAWAMDVEICVFPQDGLLNNPGTDELMVAALKDGAPCVGAAPYTDSDPHGQIDRIFEMAREFDVDIDMHLDFGSDASQLDADYVCRKTDECGWGGRVTIGHVTKFASLDPSSLSALSARLANAGVAVTVLPSTDLFLMNRDFTHNAPRGVTPVHAMLEHGVNCSLSTNNVLNPFTPFGDCSLIRMANLYANIAQAGDPASLDACFEMISSRSARLMNRKEYGLSVGASADIIIVDNTTPSMAVAELSAPVMGFKAGRRTFDRPLPRLHAPDSEVA